VYVTERCVLSLEREALTVVEVAPGIDLKRDVLDQAEMPLRVSPAVRRMDARLFRPEPMGLQLPARAALDRQRGGVNGRVVSA
jgi:acyl CoA:acetate/3-ketoacid CoA transferase